MNIKTHETVDICRKDNLGVRFLYNTLPGRLLLKILIKPGISKFFGFLMDCPWSKIFIRGFAKKNNINLEEYITTKYKSFNDFFSRQIKKELRPFPDNEYDAAAPCDGKLTVYPITAGSSFHIKHSVYTVGDLLQDKKLADEFTDGICLIFRLTPNDYHRYSCIDGGEMISHKKIKGALHTVRPISQKRYHIYTQNSREYTVIQTNHFGKVIQMEVGALFVGRVKNYMTTGRFQRGDEKGMFEFGGSTVVMLFQKDTIIIDDAIYTNTRQDKETIIRMGYKIGEKFTKS